MSASVSVELTNPPQHTLLCHRVAAPSRDLNPTAPPPPPPTHLSAVSQCCREHWEHSPCIISLHAVPRCVARPQPQPRPDRLHRSPALLPLLGFCSPAAFSPVPVCRARPSVAAASCPSLLHTQPDPNQPCPRLEPRLFAVGFLTYSLAASASACSTLHPHTTHTPPTAPTWPHSTTSNDTALISAPPTSFDQQTEYPSNYLIAYSAATPSSPSSSFTLII